MPLNAIEMANKYCFMGEPFFLFCKGLSPVKPYSFPLSAFQPSSLQQELISPLLCQNYLHSLLSTTVYQLLV